MHVRVPIQKWPRSLRIDSDVHHPSGTAFEPPSSPDAPDTHTTVVMKASIHPPKSFDGKHDDVEHFLRKMKQCLLLTQIPASQHLGFAATYLEGQPDRLWAAEKDTLALAKALAVLNWSDLRHSFRVTLGSLPL